MFPNQLKTSIKILSGQTDSLLRLKPEAYFMAFQDVAGQHAKMLGVDDKTMLQRDNAFWVVTKTKIKIESIPIWDDEIVLRTWPSHAEGVRCNRSYQMLKDNKVIIKGLSEWIIIDATTRRLRRVETTHYPSDVDWISEKALDNKFMKFKDDFLSEDIIYDRIIHSCDIDVTHHTNNVVYISMLLNTFSVKELEAMTLKEIEISYINESLEGDKLQIFRKQKEDGYYFSIKKEDGKIIVMAFLV